MRISFMAYDRPAYTGGPIINARRILPELVKRGYDVQALLGYHQDFPNADFLETSFGQIPCTDPDRGR